ncbi:MAG: response regulator [Sulfurimicrobium sp.]|jgi:DNA-binding NarL/FixJ family response regulator|nr:response regulator [Sulfurimicrobium sp.]
MKIFLVEDSPEITERLSDMISEIPGAEVVAIAESQALALAGIMNAGPDLVILDLHLANGSGMDALRQIKIMRPEIKVIVFTAFAYSQYRKKCFELGADYFLDKTQGIGKLALLLADIAGMPARTNDVHRMKGA